MAASAALRGPGSSSNYAMYGLLIPCLGVIFGFAARRKRAHCALRIFRMLACVVLAASLTSCGGGSNAGNPGSPSGTSTITVTGSTSSAGAVNHTATLKITITQ
jgi:hypothetical protein